MASNKLLDLRESSLITNPCSRVPVCLVLDCSGSMGEATASGGTKIQMLNQGVQQFFHELRTDPIANDSAEVGIVGFSDQAQILVDISPLCDEVCSTQVAETGGRTSLGRGVRTGLDLLDARKEDYKDKGVDYYQPWLVIMTDGQATDETHLSLVADLQQRVSKKKLSVIPIGIGDHADQSALSALSPGRPPLKLKNLKFSEFFIWLSKSIAGVSRSMPGEKVPLDVDGIKGWGEAYPGT